MLEELEKAINTLEYNSNLAREQLVAITKKVDNLLSKFDTKETEDKAFIFHQSDTTAKTNTKVKEVEEVVRESHDWIIGTLAFTVATVIMNIILLFKVTFIK
jgi:hypothetical protein